MKRDDLDAYHAKRRFDVTAEPRGEVAAAKHKKLTYVIQRHHATRLHFDFRLELDGVLKSWAVPKGPSLSPGEKRLAVEVEDHPLDYGGFEGSIPHGEYGGGYVLVWDHGTWTPAEDPHEGLKRGRLEFTLDGEQLHGAFLLIRTKGRSGEKKHNWLLIKKHDEFAREGAKGEVARTARVPPLDAFTAQLATLEHEIPTRGEWGYEVKLDGYRALVAVDRGKATIASRNQKDWTERFAKIGAAIGALPIENAVFDGEVCAVDAKGRTSFQDLQRALSEGRMDELVYFVFDLLFIDGFDVRDRPLAVRKAMLDSILGGVEPGPSPLVYVKHIEGAKEAHAAFAEACRQGIEGIVAKRLDRPHHAGRSTEWIKIKCTNRQELVIVGYTKPRGSRPGLGALLLGVNDGGQLRYAGKVGTGFSGRVLQDLARRLVKTVVPKAQVAGAPRLRDATWVEPSLVCEVSFTEWTRDGALRHPAFLGLREDKAVTDVVVEGAGGNVAAPAKEKKSLARATKRSRKADVESNEEVAGVTITHATRVIDGPTGTSKIDLARYYDAVAERMVPFAEKRPLAVVRCPEGVAGECFFQKKKYAGMSAAIHAEKAHGHDVLYVEDAEGIVSLVQFGAIEIHGWGARFPEPEKPDWIVIDLDPDDALPFAKVADAALEVRDVLESIELTSFVKTTGGKGLHVVAPLAPDYSFRVVKAVAQSIATSLEQRAPARFTSTMGKKNRGGGKIFVDYLRNGAGATAVLPYAVRTRPGLPVAMPIAWRDVRKVDPRDFTVATVPALVRRRKDPWRDFFTLHQRLPDSLRRIAG